MTIGVDAACLIAGLMIVGIVDVEVALEAGGVRRAGRRRRR